MTDKITLGFEIDSGAKVKISPSHIIVTGITQLSGKTTTLEALIKRSKLKAIVFKTKIGEKSFSEGTEIPPFFRDRSDYEFVRSLIEAYAREKLFIEKGTLMKLCKGSGSLLDILKRVNDTIAEGKLRGLKEEIYTRLQHYLENLIPQIQYANLSKVLTLYDGKNIMNLERFSEEAQSLIIQSVADEVLKTMKDIILVIPEAWKFIPQKYNNPCKRVVESFIRQGAASNNFIWIDSQDMAGVDKIPLKQISTWILGVQAERNEVKHTLDQIPLPGKMKPSVEDIMTLKMGHFYLASHEGVKKVYVQPVWLDEATSIKIAKGEIDVKNIDKPDSLVPFSRPPTAKTPGAEIRFDDSKLRKELIQLRSDFFNKAQEIQTFIQKVASELYNLKSSPQGPSEEELVSKVLQKMPMNNGPATQVDEEKIVEKVLARIPKSPGAVTYKVAPLEKIRKDFLEEAKNKILSDIGTLNDDEKKSLKYLETQGKGIKANELITKCFLAKDGGSSRAKASRIFSSLANIEVLRKDAGGSFFPRLRERIKEFLEMHKATEQEIDQVYNHILMEMLGGNTNESAKS